MDYVVQRERVDDLVAQATEAALAEWVAGNNVDDVLRRGRAELPLWLVEQTQRRLDPYALGIQVTAASITVLEPPNEVKFDFDSVTRAEAGIQTQVNRAQEEAERRIRLAEAEKFRIEQLTAAYTNEKVRLAQTDAEAFTARLSQYTRIKQQNPDFLAGLWWQEMGKLFTTMSASGRIDVLDNHLTGDGLDITQIAPQPGK